ncbi:protein BatD [Aliidiomarina halalkaliphila]|uniref:Protein BatD n=1 Tax=Aliidiomarina halalkaliphila TaxID=2593535 RepID=A0A552X322_9GAMM|nr:BatD family protein [Aliidiomarina halalkaliphila]TRW49366.1 protein BatD [Aliidiomarina halalkaliphila]
MRYIGKSQRQLTRMQWLTMAILSIAVCFTLPAQAQDLEVTASINKNPVLEFETFTLTVTANQGLPRNAFQPEQFLQGFDIRGTAVSSSASVINNQSVRSTEWRVTLIAPRAGDYEIPALTIEGATTQPIPLQVVEQHQDGNQHEDYFLQAELDTQQPYVQQQVRLTVRLFLAMQLETGSIQLPELEHFHVEQLGQDRQSQDIIDGRRYQVLTRTYLLTPRRSGDFSIRPIRFDGQVRVAPSGGFSAFGRLESISARSDALDLNVRPRPSNFTGHWLPSEHVLLEEQWDPNETLWTLGEPITRTVTFTAAGVRPEQLPGITIEYPQALRVYPDRGQTEMRVLRGGPVARAQYSAAIIPAHAGEFTLPAIRIPWWNTQTDQLEYAELPERTVRVIAPPGGILPPGNVDVSELSGQTPEAPEQAPSTREQTQSLDPVPISAPAPLPYQWWLLTGLCFLLWLVTLGWALLRLRQRKQSTDSASTVPVAARGALQAVKNACQNNDAAACKSALYAWHQARTGRPAAGLAAIAQSVQSEELNESLQQLEASLYSPEKTPWIGGKALWATLTRVHRHQGTEQEQTLPPLYPHH